MTRKRTILAGICGMVLLGGMAVWLTRPAEPAYEGKPVSVWLEELYTRPLPVHGSHSPFDPAWIALRKIGTNAIPTLVDMLSTRELSVKTKSILWLRKHNLISNRIKTPDERHARAFLGFQVLGTDLAASAVAEVGRLVQDEDKTVREAAVGVLADIGGRNSETIRVLIKALQDPVGEVRLSAVFSIHKLCLGRKLEVLPILSDAELRQQVVAALAKAIKDSDAGVKEISGWILGAIDPKGAKEAGVK